MRTYFSDIIPKIQRFSQRLDNLTLLTNQHWVVIDDIDKTKNVFIFRENNELLIAQNGKVEKAKWEYLGNNTLLIDRKEDSYLFKHGFFDENILALKVDSKDEYAFLVNETKYDKELNSSLSVSEFLNRKYIEPSIKQSIQSKPDFYISNNKPKPNLVVYIAPNSTTKKVSESKSLFGSVKEKYLIEFEDGEKGEIFYKKNNNQAYFKGNWPSSIKKYSFYYETFDDCIKGLHYYLKTGKTLKEGFINYYD